MSFVDICIILLAVSIVLGTVLYHLFANKKNKSSCGCSCSSCSGCDLKNACFHSDKKA